MMLRRLLALTAREDATQQDVIDCAELALIAGARDAARLLYDFSRLQSGFGPTQRERHRLIAEQTGLWESGGEGPEESPRTAPFSVDLAIAELTDLIGNVSDFSPLPANAAECVGPIRKIDLPLRRGPRVIRPTPEPDIAGSLSALVAALDDGDANALGGQLQGLRKKLLAQPAPEIDLDIGAPIDRLVAWVVTGGVRRFLLANYDLAFAPFGSAALFHAAARLEGPGLGPYLRHVGGVIRNCRDLFGLIALGAGGEPDRDVLERWVVLLSIHLDHWTILDLIDELADRNLMRAVGGVLGSEARYAPGRQDRHPVWRARDGALDVGDYDLAVRAQEIIATWAVDDRVEWSILGEIHGTNGNVGAARAAFAKCFAISPRDSSTRARVAALYADEFEPFLVLGGFGSAKSRQQLRFARWRQPRPAPLAA